MRDHGLSLSLILLLATGACQHGPTTSPETGPAHEVRDGIAMLEGDIVLGPADEIATTAEKVEARVRRGARPEGPQPKVGDAGMYDEEDGCTSIVGQGGAIVRP
jgi:hypothetical protein